MVQLQYVPYDYDTSGGYGKKCYWRILLDGKERWSNAKPFTASDDAIALAECLECYMCGGMGTWVRRSCDNVVWLASQDDKDVPVLEPGEVIVFDAAEYKAALRQGRISLLPKLRFRELRRLLDSISIPSPDLALYREPSVPDDQFGDVTLTRLQNLLLDRHGSLRTCRAPTTFVETRIGLELPGVPELVYWTPDVTVIEPICFAANPSFPLWLCSR